MFKKYLFGFLLAAIVLLGVNLLLVFISELKNVGNHNYTLTTLYIYTVMLLPQNLLDIFPYALLIGSMISFGSMAYHSEFIAMNSHGIGIKKIITIIMIQTFILAALLTVSLNYIAPKYSNEAQTIKNISLNKSVSNKGLWFKSNDFIVHVEKIITDKRLGNISIYNLHDGLLATIMNAETGVYENTWKFNNIEIRDLETNQLTKKNYYALTAKEFIPFEILKSQYNKKRYISIEDLYTNIIFHNQLGIPYENHKIVFWKKILLPFASCIIVFIGLPFLFVKMRSTNQSQRLIFGILFGITYFVISSILTNTALILGIPALMSVIMSMIIFVIFGVYLFNKLVRKHISI